MVNLHTLREDYIDSGMTLAEIANRDGVSRSWIWKTLVKMGITPRSRWHGGLLHRRGRVYVKCVGHPRAHQNDYVPRSIINWEIANGQPFPAGKEPHHANLVKDDDRPENIIPMTKSEHMRLHRKKLDTGGGCHQC